jgi:regulatory protein
VVPTITALTFQKHNKDRVNVYLDGAYAFGLTAVKAARLHNGQVLSAARIDALKAQDQQDQAFDRAVRFLSYRPRSRVEIERHLRRKGPGDAVLANVMDRLEQSGYLDDEAFARFWVDDRQRFRPRGQRALGYELRRKGVSSQIIATVLDQLDEDKAAWQAIEGRLSRWNDLTNEQLRRKVTAFLQRRGFDYEVIHLTFQRVCQTLDVSD